MIVPRTRLLVWSALLLLPFTAVGATLPGALPISVLFIGGFFACAIFDAISAPRSLLGIRLVLPDLVRLQKDRPGSFEVKVQNEATNARAVRIGFAFPPEIETPADDLVAALPAGAPLASISWAVTPRERGLFRLDRVHLEAISPFGFWAKRGSQPAQTELRVYPNLFAERKQVAAFFLRRGLAGSRAHRQAGQGREFEKLREYLPGDSIDEIHWKASAKRGHPVTKVFQVERTQEVYVIVDASRLAGRKVEIAGSGVATVLERFVTAALILGAAAERQGDQFGLITFSDRVLSFVRAKNGQAHFDACRDRLYTLQPQAVTPDFEELCAFIRLRLRKRALLIFLTDLDDPMLAETFARSAELIARQHLVLANMMQPVGAEPLFQNGEVASVPDLYRRLGGHLRWHDLRELGKVLQRRGIRLALLNPERLAAEVLAQHADVKARQLL